MWDRAASNSEYWPRKMFCLPQQDRKLDASNICTKQILLSYIVCSRLLLSETTTSNRERERERESVSLQQEGNRINYTQLFHLQFYVIDQK